MRTARVGDGWVSGPERGLLAAHDGGQTWEEALSFGDGGTGLFDLGFTTPEIGVVVYGDGQLFRTTDRGRQWVPVEMQRG